MSQCVPDWDLDDNHPTTPIKVPFLFHPNSNMMMMMMNNNNNNTAKASAVIHPTCPTTKLDYEVAELTWENGQLGMHGLGPPRVVSNGKPVSSSSSKYKWPGKPRVNSTAGTLESIVHQAVQLGPSSDPPIILHDEIVPWFNNNHQRRRRLAAIDARVPPSVANSTNTIDHFVHNNSAKQIITNDPACHGGIATKSTHHDVESCGGTTSFEREEKIVRKRSARVVAQSRAAREGCSSRNQSVSISDTFGRESNNTRQVIGTADSFDMGFTSATSLDSDTIDDRDSVSHTRPHQKQARTEEDTQNDKSTISTKRSRAAAIHNQSERKRRDKINQRMKTLQKLVPNSSKTDKASMLDEVIEYLKTLQAQVNMMSRMSMPLPHQMMMPAAAMTTMQMQQQLQMSIMAQMGMQAAGMAGMGMGMGSIMDHPMNSIGRQNIPGIHQVLNPAAAAFMSMASWDGTNDRLPAAGSNAVMPDPMATFLATCQTQPMTMDAYSRMAAIYQQLHQQVVVPNSKT